MHVVSDDERREVSARLRHEARACIHSVLISPGDALRLADLIDPGESGQNRDRNLDTVQQESPAVQKASECDREALLALAGQLDSLGLNGFSSGWSSGAVNVGSFARRIREACGEVWA